MAVNNGDLNTIAALADWFADAGFDDAADCCHWVFAKKRWPARWGDTTIVAWLAEGRSLLPHKLTMKLPNEIPHPWNASVAFDRLLQSWTLQSTPVKDYLWRWKPPS